MLEHAVDPRRRGEAEHDAPDEAEQEFTDHRVVGGQRVHRRLDYRQRPHRRRPPCRRGERDRAAKGVADKVSAVAKQLGDPFAVARGIVRPAEVGRLAVPWAVGDDQLEAVVGETLLVDEVRFAADVTALHPAVDEDDARTGCSPMTDV